MLSALVQTIGQRAAGCKSITTNIYQFNDYEAWIRTMAGLVGCPTFVLIIWPESGQIPSWLSGGGILHLSSYRGAAHIGNEN